MASPWNELAFILASRPGFGEGRRRWETGVCDDVDRRRDARAPLPSPAPRPRRARAAARHRVPHRAPLERRLGAARHRRGGVDVEAMAPADPRARHARARLASPHAAADVAQRLLAAPTVRTAASALL